MTYRGYILRGATALYLTLCYSPATGSEWGLRAGGLYGATELADGLGFGLSGFVRRPLSPRYHIEFGGGYGRLRGADYTTDLAVAEGRLRYALGRGQFWRADLYAGAGALRYDLADSPPQTTPDADAIGWSTTAPVGIGFQRPLGPGRRLDLDLGYTYTLRDDINRAILEKGNDGYWSLTVGLVFGGADPARSLPRAESTATSAATPTAPSVAETDRDDDGLSDRDETQRYYTNPVMRDSDGDGLDDREEVEIYLTDPNRPDSDRGGVADGAEIARGAAPLDSGDDFVPESILEEEPVPLPPVRGPLPAVFFPAGGTVLVGDARDNLRRVANFMRQEAHRTLELRGHSDSVGSRAANLRLSRQRAEAVRDHLIELGVEPRRLKVRALGERDPIASNATEQGRLKNRRVDLVPR